MRRRMIMIVVVRRHDDVSTVGVFWTRARVWTLNTPPPPSAPGPRPATKSPPAPKSRLAKKSLRGPNDIVVGVWGGSSPIRRPAPSGSLIAASSI